ncbi:MAG: hypothetical protein KBT31_05565 [Firmicutes bacterium]|nr:hypothetical protein [Candidatus Colimorpha enterica]
MNNEKIIGILNKKPELKDGLFIRGFLVTDDESVNTSAFPFFGEWKEERHSSYRFITHRLTGIHTFTDRDGRTFFILGHAYDPFSMKWEEDEILADLSEAYENGAYLDKINDLTGVFVIGMIDGDRIDYLVDPSGMLSCASGLVGGKFFLCSHPQIVGDVKDLTMDPDVKELTEYRWYGRVMGPYLPADMTPFKELKRTVPDITYTRKGNEIVHRRFWPLKEDAEKTSDIQTAITEGADILKKNMLLVTKKWAKPMISLTGGIDSNTTFAAANGLYDKVGTFSYVSAEKEIRDAEAAKTISEHFGVPHTEYHIPDDSSEIPDFEERREIFRHNNGYVAEGYDNEVRKRLYLHDNSGYDVEVKSWVSETIRAYWYKHYGRKTMPKLSPKLFRNLYKIFIFNRKLAHKVDGYFEKYIKEYEYDKIPSSYPPADMHYNEVTWGSWGGMFISEMKYCFDITFIYNNRRFFDAMFRLPLEMRITDEHHLKMKEYLCPELYDMHIRVVNMKETDTRAFLLNVIFTINSFLPF